MKSNKVIYGILIALILVLGVFAQVLLSVKPKKEVLGMLEYKEDASASYRVYTFKNPFYQEEFIPEGKTYVANYVDKITAFFNYTVDYSDKLKGSYDYYVKAKLVAFNPGDEEADLWTKEYNLCDKETVNFVSDDSYQLKKTIDINFQEFRADFENYKATTGVMASAKLIVEFICNNEGKYKGIDDFSYSASTKLEFPVSDATFKINTSTSVNNDTHKIIKTRENDEDLVFIKIIAVLLWILAIFAAVVLIIIYSNNVKKLTYYEKLLKRILTTYDDIIVNVESLPFLKDLSVVEVTSFDELLDAQEEVSLPINFKEDKKKRVAKFILVKDTLAWVYTLKESDLK